MTTQTIYLHDIALDEAITAWHAALARDGLLQPLPAETLPLTQALGRITAAPIYAKISAPHYHASAMDGYAVRSEETRGATETQPHQLTLGTQAIYVDTGDPLPAGMNAVIKIENVQVANGQIEIIESIPPWRDVRAMGEDMVATELVLTANHQLRPQDLGAIAGCGHSEVTVYRRPRVAILPTGSELVAPGSPLKPGDIIEYNSLMLGAQAEDAGALVTRFPIVRDERALILTTVRQALAAHDLVVINAGSSAGSEDFTAGIVAELGQLCVHGIAIRPGHPVILGVAAGKALVGIPGYPVSAALTFDLLVKPLLYRWQGLLPPERPQIEAVLTRKVVSPMGEDEFLRVMLGRVGDRVLATPLSGGAGVITSLVKADGLVTIRRFSEGRHAGERVTVDLLCERRKVDATILAIGSHDMTLDLLADAVKRSQPTVRLVSAHVGSMGGLLALQRGEAHLAGSHLLDESSGLYNVDAIQRLLTPHGVKVLVIGFVKRVQGFIVPKGNPKQLQLLDDLLLPEVVFVNRQRGAGTRVLLDYALKQRNLDARRIQGYERQEYTHLAVAAAVKSGAADCGLGILAAARALDLDFVPLFDESYQLLVPVQHYASTLLAPLWQIINDPLAEFRQAVEQLGGYDTSEMGKVLTEL